MTDNEDLLRLLGTNAHDLLDEAQLLLDAGRPARAFALTHVAMEELAKATKVRARAFRNSAAWLPNSTSAEMRDHRSKEVYDIRAFLDILREQGLVQETNA